MFIVCLTGTFAVISHELDWLFNDNLRVSSQPESEINWDLMYQNVKKRFPDSSNISIYKPLYSNFSSIVSVNDSELGVRRVFINPYTGEVKGDLPHYASFQRVLRDLHRYLLSPFKGLYIVGPLGIILLISTISALFFYKKWWQGFFKLRLNNGPRAFWGSLHKVIGLWSLWFLLLIGLTGTWYFAEKIIADAGVDIQEKRVLVAESTLQDNHFSETQISASKAISIAKSTIPNFTPTRLTFAPTQSDIIKIVGDTDAMLVRSRSNSVSINPVTGEVLYSRETKNHNALEVWIDIVDPLHFGNFSGLFIKLIWFFFGLLTCVMSVSGIIIFAKRIGNRKQGSWIQNILGSMKYVTFIVLIIPISFGTIHILYAQNIFAYVEHHDQIALAPKTAIENFPKATMYIANTNEKTALRVSFDCHQCLFKKHKTVLHLTDGRIIKFKTSLISGYRGAATATIKHAELALIKSVVIKYGEDRVMYLYPQQ